MRLLALDRSATNAVDRRRFMAAIALRILATPRATEALEPKSASN